MTIGELLVLYLDNHVVNLKDRLGTTRRLQRYLAPFDPLALGELTKMQVIQWHQEIGRTRGCTAANQALQQLHAMYVKAEEWELFTGKNPAHKIKKFPKQSRERFVQSNELPWLLKSLADEMPRTEIYFLTLLLTGARRDEARTMQWTHLDLDRALWHKPTTKTGVPHTIPLPAQLVTRLQTLPRVNQWVFPSTQNPRNGMCAGRWSVTGVEHAWQKIRRRVGLVDVRIHDLRRTAASWLSINDSNIQVISAMLNHKSLTSTQIYARLSVEPVRQALNDHCERMARARLFAGRAGVPCARRTRDAGVAGISRRRWSMAVTVQRRNDKPGWWVFIHYRGQRRKKYFGTNKALAVEFAKKLEAKLKLGEAGVRTRSGLTIDAYAATWLDRIRHARKHTTHEDYQARLARDILPVLTGLDLDDITRERVKEVAFAGLNRQQAPKTVQNTIRVLSSLLSHAQEDGLIQQNHAMRPGSFLPKINKRQAVDPLTREEVATFLATVRDHAPRYYPLFLCAVRTGLRMGEVLALQWDDCDFHGRFLHIQRNYTHWKVTTPKSGQSRRVDMSRALCRALQDLQIDRQFDAAATGTAVPLWVFCSETGGLLHPHNLRDRVFYGLLKKAGLRRVRFHDLRHTFASLLLQQGESPVYVKEQLGHSSIQITVDCYGHLIPGGNKQAVDRLDEGDVSDGSKNEKSCVSLPT